MNTNGVVNKLRFNLFVNIPPANKWGGLLFMWRQGQNVEPMYLDSNKIALWVYLGPSHNP